MPQFFTVKFAVWACGGLLLALVAVLGVEEFRIHNWKKDFEAQGVKLTQAVADLAVSRANVATCSAALDSQNAAVDGLKSQMAALKAQRDAAAKAALAARKSSPPVVGTGPDVMNAWMRHQYGVKQ